MLNPVAETLALANVYVLRFGHFGGRGGGGFFLGLLALGGLGLLLWAVTRTGRTNGY
jgi:hypothetical protein